MAEVAASDDIVKRAQDAIDGIDPNPDSQPNKLARDIRLAIADLQVELKFRSSIV